MQKLFSREDTTVGGQLRNVCSRNGLQLWLTSDNSRSGFCEYGDELPVSILGAEFPDHVSYWQLHGVPYAVPAWRLRPVTHK